MFFYLLAKPKIWFFSIFQEWLGIPEYHLLYITRLGGVYESFLINKLDAFKGSINRLLITDLIVFLLFVEKEISPPFKLLS